MARETVAGDGAATGDGGTQRRVASLRQAVEALLGLAEGIPSERLYAAPGGDDWSLMQVLAHVTEFLPYWASQAREVAARTRDNQPFGRTHDDPDRIKAVEDQARASLATMRDMLNTSLATCTALLEAIPADGWQRTGRHARRGEMSVAQFVDDFLVSHLDEHLAQAEALVQAPAAGPPP